MKDTPTTGQALCDMAARLLRQIPADDHIATCSKDVTRSLAWRARDARGRQILEAFAALLEEVPAKDPAADLCEKLAAWVRHTIDPREMA